MSALMAVAARVAEVAVLATPILLALAVFCRRARRSSPAFVHGLVLTGLVAIAALLVTPRGATPLPLPATWTGVLETLANPSAAPAQLAPPTAAPVTNTGERPDAHVPARPRPLLWLTAFWLAGCALLVADFLIGLWSLRGVRRKCVPYPSGEEPHRRPRVLLGDVAGSFTFGFLDPVVVLPREAASWSRERLDSVLLHERAHVERRDWLSHCCARLLRAVFWFHPLVWWAVARLAREAEAACDQAVLRRGVRPSAYASVLLAAAGGPVPRVGLAMAGSNDARRIREVLDEPRESTRPLGRGVAVTSIVALALGLGQVRLGFAAERGAPGGDLALVQARWAGGGHTACVFLRGAATIAADDGEVEGVEPGGSLLLVSREDATGVLRQYHVASARGVTWRSYAVDGVQRPFDDDARDWLRTVLPQARYRLREADTDFLRGGRTGYFGVAPERLSGSTQHGARALTRDGGRTVAGRIPGAAAGDLVFFKGGDVDLGPEDVERTSADGWLVAVREGANEDSTVVWTAFPAPDGTPRTSSWRDGAPVASEREAWATTLGALREVDWLRAP